MPLCVSADSRPPVRWFLRGFGNSAKQSECLWARAAIMPYGKCAFGIGIANSEDRAVPAKMKI